MSTTLSATYQTSIQGMARTEAIKVGSCTILGVIVVVFLTRQFMKATVFRKVAIDDLFVLVATILAIGLCLTTFVLASEGLGTPGFLSLKDADILMKGYYATGFLYISAICLAKLSLLVLFYNIVVSHRLHRRTVVCFGIIILIWTLGSLLALAFQCKLPRPWMTPGPQCFNPRIFWIVYCVIDISTEIAVIMLSINLVAFLRLRFSRKLAVVACFAPRALVVGAAVAHLIWLHPSSHYSEPQYRLWLPILMMQVQICLSICTASIPFMVPYFKNLETNLRRTYIAKSGDFQTAPRRPRSLACFRTERERDVLSSWDSADKSERFDTVPHLSPYVSVSRISTPFTPPLVNTPASAASWSERSLNLRIPDFHTWRQRPTELEVPRSSRSRSSFRSSLCATPHVLMSRFSIRAPSPYRNVKPCHSRTSSEYSDDSVTGSGVPQGYKFHIFPPLQPNGRSPVPRKNDFVAPSVPPIRAPRSQKTAPTTTHAVELSPFNAQECSFTHVRALRISKTPQPKPPPAASLRRSKTKRRKTASRELDSPMWEAINHYFNGPGNPPSAVPSTPPAIAQPGHGQRVCSPSESGSTNSGTGTSSPAHHTILCNEWCLPRDPVLTTANGRTASRTSGNISLQTNRTSRAQPPLRKARPTL